MRSSWLQRVLCSGVFALFSIHAQSADPNLMREVGAVRANVAENNQALRQYTWSERTEVLVKGKVKSSTDAICGYNRAGEITRAPAGSPSDKSPASGISKRPTVRKKADMEDYIERAVSMVQTYVPPKPDQIQYLLDNGFAALGRSSGGEAEIRFHHYYKKDDALVFTYDPVSKRLLRVNVSSNLGTPKDPVTMEARFETLPDGVNHLASTHLEAKAKKVEVNTRNESYQKTGN